MQLQQILLIDDDADDQELFLTALENLDIAFDCKTAADGQDAYNKLVSNQIIPNLIFLDLNMPLMNGQQFLQKIKQVPHLKNIPVVIFTTSSNPQAIRDVKHLGAKSLITKPNSFTELITLLTNVLNCFIKGADFNQFAITGY